MSKKVYLLAFQRALNYGALLQIYALKTVISKKGFDVTVIDYVPSWMRITYKNQPNLLSYFKRKLMIQFFNPFFKKLGLKNNTIYSLSELENRIDDGDIYIVGSDQVWNEKLIQRNNAYFLSFVPKSRTKIGYAISMGDSSMSEEFKKEMLPHMKRFNFISAREKYVVDFIKENIDADIDIPVLLDPTLLLNKDDYRNIASKKVFKKPFIAVYPCMHDQNLYDLALHLKKKTKLPIVNLGFHFKGADINDYLYGPENWINRIDNAQYFITNSFHGTAFAILHETQFMVVPNSNPEDLGLNSRFTELLDSLGLSGRLVYNKDEVDLKMDSPIDFHRASINLNKRRRDSFNFINKALSVDGNI